MPDRTGPETASSLAVAAAALVSGPRTALSTVRQALVEAAAQPGSGWDVSEGELCAVLSPELLRRYWRAAATGNAQADGVEALQGVMRGEQRPGSSGLGADAGAAAARRASAGKVRAESWALAGAGGVGPGGVLVTPEWQAAGVGRPGSREGGDMLISWPELCNTLLYLLNK